MAVETGISWCNHTFNIVWGCEKVSPACKNCYAETLAERFGFDVWGSTKPRRTFGEKHWNEPRKWQKMAMEDKVKRLVFCSSMCDLFEDHPTVVEELKKLWPLIRQTPDLIWLLLTKRSDRIAMSLPQDWNEGYPNVWLGTTVENNDYVWRADCLKQIPTVCRFISYEPACGPLDAIDLNGLHWMIFGGESGANFRQHDPQWARDIRERCEQKGIAFFYKQGSSLRSGEDETLDGKIYHNFPVGHAFYPNRAPKQKSLNVIKNSDMRFPPTEHQND